MTKSAPRWLWMGALLLLVAGALPHGGTALAQRDAQTFPETGKTLQGKFLAYWQTHGGLAQQGFPISNSAPDVSDTNGKTYETQYLERAVYEMHPENAGTPFEVLGALLGVFQYQAKYPNGAPNQHGSTDNAVTFKETGKALGGKFRAYWQSHGGVLQQGFPISDEFQEKSDLNGQTYTVQYFERAVFELHPEHAGTPFEVLLSQLGTFQYRARTDLSFTDFTGTKVTLTKRPEKIVCLIALCEDILYELGIDPAGVSDTFGEQPQFWGARAKSFAHIGGSFPAPNLEDIARIKPDLVIGFLPHIGLRPALAPISPLFIVNPAKYQDSIAYLKTVGRLTNHTYQANQATNRFLARMGAYKARAPQNKLPLILFGRDVNFSIFTAGSLFGSVLSAVTNYPWPAPGSGDVGAPDQEPGSLQYSLEKILDKDPDVLLVETQGSGAPLSDQLKANPIWSQLKAVQQGHVYEVSPQLYLFGRGTRSLSLALDDAMTKIYPEVFPRPLP